MNQGKQNFRIGELANNLSIERFVIRFWEKEFGIKAKRTTGGQRFYNEDDLKNFQTIKSLLYEKKFTIAGAKEILKKNKKVKHELDSIIASHITTIDEDENKNKLSDRAIKNLRSIREDLKKLRSLL